MSINLVTYAGQTVTPTNDAIIYERAVGQNGIFHGCEITVSDNNVNITGGYGLICGREFVVQSESIAVTLSGSGTISGRLYVRLDLADADEPIKLLTATGNSLPALTQDDDVNYTNGVYEMELATFDVGVSALSNCVETYHVIEDTYKDYEIGVSGGYNYRSWKNGIVEIWGSVSVNCNNMAAFASGLYRIEKEVSFGIISTLGIAALTSEQFLVRTTGGSGYATVWSAYIDSNNKAHIQVVGSAANAGDVVVDYYIVGKKS